MEKVLAKNPATGDEIDAARRANRGRPTAAPHYTPDKTRNNPVDELTANAIGIAAVAGGQAVTDEIVEWLAREYGVGKGVVVHLLIEMGVPVALGVAAHYLTDEDQTMIRNVGVGVLAAGTVNGVRIAISKLQDFMSDSSSDDSSENERKQMQGLSAQKRRRLAEARAYQQIRAQEERRHLPPAPRGRQPQRERSERRSSGTLSAGTASGNGQAGQAGSGSRMSAM